MRPGQSVLFSVFLLWSRPLAPQDQLPAAVYHVRPDGDDSSPGTAERPWRHLEWAMTRPFLRAGDTIRVGRGVYRPVVEPSFSRDSPTDDALIRPVASGEPGRPITVMADPGEPVVLSGRSLAASWEPVGSASHVYYHDYFVPAVFPFDHPFQVVEDGRLLYRVATIEALDRPGRAFVDTTLHRIYLWTTDSRPPASHLMEYGVSIAGIEFQRGARHWRLAGLRLIGFRTAAIQIRDRAGWIEGDRLSISYVGAHRPGADVTSGHAIATYDTSGGIWVHDSNLHHTLAEAVHISQTGAGGDVYENNDIHDAGGPEWFHETHTGRVLTGPGLILRGSRAVVRANRFYANGYHGLILESDLRGSEGPAAPSENLIEGNVFTSNGGNGLYGDGKNGVSASRGNVIRFNLLDHNNQARPGSTGDAELRLAGNLDDTLVYNNTFYGDQSNGVLVYAGREAAGTAQGADAIPERLRLLNNIVVHVARTPGLYPLRVIDADFAADYNNWFRPAGGTLVSWNGAGFASLDEFRGSSGQERHGVSVDPRFVSAENGHFWLRAVSPMIGRGLAENGASADLGAFPYRPLLAAFPAELRFVTLAGRDPAPQVIEIRSPAEKALAFTVRIGGEPWLRLSAIAGETPAALSLSVRQAGLAPGTYSTSVQITPALEGEPPMSVRVNLTILAAPPRRR